MNLGRTWSTYDHVSDDSLLKEFPKPNEGEEQYLSRLKIQTNNETSGRPGVFLPDKRGLPTFYCVYVCQWFYFGL